MLHEVTKHNGEQQNYWEIYKLMRFCSCGCKNNAHARLVNGLIARARVYTIIFFLHLLDNRQLLLRRPTPMPSAIVSAHMGCCSCSQTINGPTCDHHRLHHYLLVGDCDVWTRCVRWLLVLSFVCGVHWLPFTYECYKYKRHVLACMCVCHKFHTFASFQVSQLVICWHKCICSPNYSQADTAEIVRHQSSQEIVRRRRIKVPNGLTKYISWKSPNLD